MGIAFQMIDDLLPVGGEDITVGTMESLVDLVDNKR
jgi:geranylgeranyl pyrophosphate synthase